MMAKKLVIANWKMNFNISQASVFMHRLSNHVKKTSGTEIVICPSSVALQPLYKDIDHNKFKLGAQNMHYADHGTFTGEVSGQMLDGLASYVIVGHSERRYQFNENDIAIAKKVAAAVRHGIVPVLCVGDRMVDRQDGMAKTVVNDQITSNLGLVTANEIKSIVIAYEPVWAISGGDGNGETAKPAEIKSMVELIRNSISDLYGKTAGKSVRVLYGGSVNPQNAKSFVDLEGIDGFLVGGASLNYAQFADIIKIVQKA
jgi:triosephosphate isomerase (TIM)